VTSTGIIIHVVGKMGVAIKPIIEEASTPGYPAIHGFEPTSRGFTRAGLALRSPNGTMD
jgi:acetone carboxylase gamma subunit